jgi:hypothetical protein
VLGKSFAIDDCVYVKNDGDRGKVEPERPDCTPIAKELEDRWVAHLPEIRALDPKDTYADNVYLLVSWLHSPEDITTGRLRHHGSHELMPSNSMQTIDASKLLKPSECQEWHKKLTKCTDCDGKTDVYRWNNWDENEPLPRSDQLF